MYDIARIEPSSEIANTKFFFSSTIVHLVLLVDEVNEVCNGLRCQMKFYIIFSVGLGYQLKIGFSRFDKWFCIFHFDVKK